jgi:hypothetical protein
MNLSELVNQSGFQAALTNARLSERSTAVCEE